MEPRRLWMMLNELAGRLEVEVRLERLQDGEGYETHGGLVRLGGRLVAIVDQRRGDGARCEQLGRALLEMDLEGWHMRPALREYLEYLADSEPL
jgi:hypothetical protein